MLKNLKIGFDLGNSSLKIAVAEKEGEKFYELPLPENLMEEDVIAMPHAFSAFLKKTKKELHLPNGPAALMLPSSQVICRLVTMPRMTVDQLMLNLPYEFNDFIHGEPHQYHCDYALCENMPIAGEHEAAEDTPEEPEEMTMMAAVVNKQRVVEYTRMFAAGGFAVRCMLPQEMTLIGLVKEYRLTHPDAPEDFCFIDLGYLSTRIFVVQGDRMQATRRIPSGCRELDGIVADILNIDPFLTDAYKRGNHQDILHHPRCVELYEHLAVEALKLVNFYHFTYRQNQLNGIYLIGGGAQIEPLRKTLSDTLSLPALPIEELLPGADAQNSTFACAAGLLADPGKEE